MQNCSLCIVISLIWFKSKIYYKLRTVRMSRHNKRMDRFNFEIFNHLQIWKWIWNFYCIVPTRWHVLIIAFYFKNLAANDLPPKYEDVVKSPYTGVPIEMIPPSSSLSQQPPPPPPLPSQPPHSSNNSDSAHTQQTQRYWCVCDQTHMFYSPTAII